MVGYYKGFIEGFTKLVGPLIKFAHRDTLFRWHDSCEETFQELKRRLTSIPILTLLIKGNEYDIYAYTSHRGFGPVLMQRGKVITDVSHKLKKYKTQYLTHNLKLAMTIFTLKI